MENEFEFRSGMALGEFVAGQDDDRRALLEQEIARAEALSGTNFGHVRILDTGEMGEAAGLCHMCSGEIEVRRDIVDTEEGIRGDLCHVLTHEGEHADGDGMEGFTELSTSLRTGRAPVPAYRTRVDHARHVADVIGREKAQELARERNGEVLLLGAYVRERIQRGIAVDEAASEEEEHIRQAA